jgi:hypothetical protein
MSDKKKYQEIAEKAFGPEVKFYGNPDCPKPVTRRDFMGQVLGASAGFAAMPTIYDLLISSALAACDGEAGAASPQQVVFLVFDYRGGPNPNGAFLPGLDIGDKTSWRKVTNFERRGGVRLDTLNQAGQINTDFGGEMWNEHALTQALRASTSASARAATDFIVLPVRTENDYSANDGDRQSNRISPANVLSQIVSSGRLFKGVGTSASLSGGSQPSPVAVRRGDASFTQIRSPAQVRAAVAPGITVSNLGNQNAGFVWDSLQKMSNSQIDFLNQKPTQKNVQDVLSCMNKSGKNLSLGFSPNSVDPAGEELARAIFQIPPNGANAAAGVPSELITTGTLCHMLANGNATGGVIEIGGGDYHQQDANNVEGSFAQTANVTVTGQGVPVPRINTAANFENGFDTRAGMCLGAAIEYFHRKNVKAFIVTIQDGGTNTGDRPGFDNGRVPPSGDDAQAGIASVWVVNGNQAVRTGGSNLILATNSRQVGKVTVDAGVDNSVLGGISSNPEAISSVIVANYMAAAGLNFADPKYAGYFNLITNNPASLGANNQLVKLKKILT